MARKKALPAPLTLNIQRAPAPGKETETTYHSGGGEKIVAVRCGQCKGLGCEGCDGLGFLRQYELL